MIHLFFFVVILTIFSVFDPPPYRRGNVLTVGSSQSGKTHATILRTLKAALSNACGIVVIDPHCQALAHKLFELLVAYGIQSRVLFDRFSDFERALQYRFLHPPAVANQHECAALIDVSARHYIDILGRRRDVASLAKHPQTEECTLNALLLLLYQRKPQAATKLKYAYRPRTAQFRSLVQGCAVDDIRDFFVKVGDGIIKPAFYASAKRLIDAVTSSPLFSVRCSDTPSFDLPSFLDNRGILLVEGGGPSISRDAQSTILGAIVLDVINYVRTRGSRPHRILLVLDEATNARLVSSHEALALNELQKDAYGLDIHVIVQTPSFPSTEVGEAVFQNCQRHEWMFCASNAVAQLGGSDLGDADYRLRIQRLRRGERFVKSDGRTFFDVVPAIADPWGVPGLGAEKAAEALAEIRERKEYRSPSCLDLTSTIVGDETQRSLTSPPVTPSPPRTFSISSPARRLATGGSEHSANAES